MSKKSVAIKLKIAREEMGWSQADLARSYGSTPQAISQMERGARGVGLESLQRLARLLNKPTNWFLEDAGEPELPPLHRPMEAILKEAKDSLERLEMRELPLRGFVPAGYPATEEEQSPEYIPIPAFILGASKDKKGLYLLRISGESLIDDGIHNKDIVVIDPDYTYQDGKLYALRLGNEVVARHVQKLDGKVRLSPANSHYKDIYKSGEIEILGRIIAWGGWNKAS